MTCHRCGKRMVYQKDQYQYVCYSCNRVYGIDPPGINEDEYGDEY